eukprot:SAG11_NODE_1519_length_4759_cov_2.821030_3_plen_580_part_00
MCSLRSLQWTNTQMAALPEHVQARKLLVLGGTGSTGQWFCRHALSHGYSVRVVTRNPENVTVDRFDWAGHPNLELVKCDLLDDLIGETCASVDAVVSLAGPPTKTKNVAHILPTAIRNVVAGMRKYGVKSLLIQCGAFTRIDGKKDSIMESAAKKTFGSMMGEAETLQGNQEAANFLLAECEDIDWIITRPAMLSDGPSTGTIETVPEGEGTIDTPGGTPTKKDLTRWYLKLLDDDSAIHTAPKPQYSAEDYSFAEERVDGGQKKVAVITGSNSGLGFETARVLLLKGMSVVCACRSPEKGAAAVAELLAATAHRPDASSSDCVFMQLDVSSLQSVQEFAASYLECGLKLHVLLCNAGIMMGPRRESVDGTELQLATNYLGHFLLCQLLREKLVACAPARVIHVTSIAARFGKVVLADLESKREPYNSQATYSMTKLMQMIFSRTFAMRLEGTGVTSNSLEPGIVNTGLSHGITDDPAMQKRIQNGVSVEEGARTHIYLAASGKVTGETGGNWEDCIDLSKGLKKGKYLLAAPSLGRKMNDELWAATEDLITQILARNSVVALDPAPEPELEPTPECGA